MAGAVVVDSYAWVEYADGSDEGARARQYIEGSYTLYTPAIVVAELADRATRLNRHQDWMATLYPFIRHHTTIVPLGDELANRAGEVKWEMRDSSLEAGLADAIVLATARVEEAQVLTGDRGFLVADFTDEVIDITSE